MAAAVSPPLSPMQGLGVAELAVVVPVVRARAPMALVLMDPVSVALVPMALVPLALFKVASTVAELPQTIVVVASVVCRVVAEMGREVCPSVVRSGIGTLMAISISPTCHTKNIWFTVKSALAAKRAWAGC